MVRYCNFQNIWVSFLVQHSTNTKFDLDHVYDDRFGKKVWNCSHYRTNCLLCERCFYGRQHYFLTVWVHSWNSHDPKDHHFFHGNFQEDSTDHLFFFEYLTNAYKNFFRVDFVVFYRLVHTECSQDYLDQWYTFTKCCHNSYHYTLTNVFRYWTTLWTIRKDVFYTDFRNDSPCSHLTCRWTNFSVDYRTRHFCYFQFYLVSIWCRNYGVHCSLDHLPDQLVVNWNHTVTVSSDSVINVQCRDECFFLRTYDRSKKVLVDGSLNFLCSDLTNFFRQFGKWRVFSKVYVFQNELTHIEDFFCWPWTVNACSVDRPHYRHSRQEQRTFSNVYECWHYVWNDWKKTYLWRTYNDDSWLFVTHYSIENDKFDHTATVERVVDNEWNYRWRVDWKVDWTKFALHWWNHGCEWLHFCFFLGRWWEPYCFLFIQTVPLCLK